MARGLRPSNCAAVAMAFSPLRGGSRIFKKKQRSLDGGDAHRRARGQVRPADLPVSITDLGFARSLDDRFAQYADLADVLRRALIEVRQRGSLRMSALPAAPQGQGRKGQS